MFPLEEAITKRASHEAIAALQADPQQATASTTLGVSMLMLALYYELPDVATTIRTHLPALTFFEAASMGDLETVSAAVAQDPRLVDAYAPDGFTVLGLAIFFRQPDIAQWLVKAGADVNLPANNARAVAPIHAACARKDLRSLRLLLENGANPNARQQGSGTPLSQARQAGNSDVAALLIEFGASDR